MATTFGKLAQALAEIDVSSPIVDDSDDHVYWPMLGDNTQNGCSVLFNLLVEVLGPGACAAMKKLEEEHSEPDQRR